MTFYVPYQGFEVQMAENVREESLNAFCFCAELVAFSLVSSLDAIQFSNPQVI
jgi:hypothetical protein